MSISDVIVVMRDGILQQQGKPQEVYDDPANLFVASFLGTPPINLFEGRIENERLYIGSDSPLAAKGLADGKVTVGVRPEGFVPKKDGALSVTLNQVEVMGRDVTLVCDHPAAEKRIRAIVSAEEAGGELGDLRFDLKPHKTLIFDESGARLRPEV